MSKYKVGDRVILQKRLRDSDDRQRPGEIVYEEGAGPYASENEYGVRLDNHDYKTPVDAHRFHYAKEDWLTPNNSKRDIQKAFVKALVLDALAEQKKPKRGPNEMHFGVEFESRINESGSRTELGDLLLRTEALELLAEMIGAIDEEVQR